MLVTLHKKARSSRPEVFCKKVFLKILQNKSSFTVNFAKFSKNTFFHRTLLVAPSEKLKAGVVIRKCSVKKVFLQISQNSQENTCTRVSFLQR